MPWRSQRFWYQTALSLISIFAGTSARQVSHSEVVWPQNTYGRDLRKGAVMLLVVSDRSRVWCGRNHDNGVGHERGRQKMKQGEGADQGAVRFDELPNEALRAIEADGE